MTEGLRGNPGMDELKDGVKAWPLRAVSAVPGRFSVSDTLKSRHSLNKLLAEAIRRFEGVTMTESDFTMEPRRMDGDMLALALADAVRRERQEDGQ